MSGGCHSLVRASGATQSAPSASLASPVARDNTGDMWEHVFGHQASRTRPLEVARAAARPQRRWRSESPGEGGYQIRPMDLADLRFLNFDDFQNFRFPNSIMFLYFETKNQNYKLSTSQTKRPGERYLSKAHPVQFSTQTDHFKNDDFLEFSKISRNPDLGSDTRPPRVIRSSISSEVEQAARAASRGRVRGA